jgi:restriction endonuclease S subunit
MSFPRYPKYKASGVEWLGEVPEHWQHASLTRIASRVVVGIAEAATHAYADDGVPILRSTNIRPGRIVGDILFVKPEFANDRGSKLICAGDLVTVRTGNAGVTAVVPPELDGCQCFTMLITSLNKGYLQKYYCYWMNSLSAQCYFSLEGWGTAQVNISVPPRAPMKPSGIEWLGDVPAHWNIVLLKRAFRSVDYGISDALDSDGSIAILRMGNIENGHVVMDDLKFTDAVEPDLLLQRGDLLYNRTNSLDLIGKVGMFVGAPYAVSFASYLVRMRTVHDCIPEFFAYLLNTDGILGLARSSAFVAIGQCNLNPTRYGQIVVAIPPKDEQAAIVRSLERTPSSTPSPPKPRRPSTFSKNAGPPSSRPP